VKKKLDVIKRERDKKLVVGNEVTYLHEFIEIIIFIKKGGIEKLREYTQHS
jgi:hypothetical protein